MYPVPGANFVFKAAVKRRPHIPFRARILSSRLPVKREKRRYVKRYWRRSTAPAVLEKVLAP